jgi:hypothetical protein
MTVGLWNRDRNHLLSLNADSVQRCAGQIEALGRPVEPHDARDVVIVA